MVDDVFAAVADWDTMRSTATDLADRLRSSPPPTEAPDDVAEAATFLDWLADDHFTFVGAVRVDADGVVVAGSELGVARRRPLVREGAVVDGGAPWMLLLTKVLHALDRPPRRAPRLRERAPGRRRRLVPGGGAVRRPLHRQRLQPVGGDDPAAAPEGRPGHRPIGLPASEPRRPHPAVTCSRATRATSCSASASTSWRSSPPASCAWGCADGSASS